ETYGADVGYQINDKTKVTVGYYHQNGDVGEASGSGASAGLNYDITNNLTAGLKVSYDDAFETRVMATINWSFADLFKGDEAGKEATTNAVMKALNASPSQRDVRVHDFIILLIGNLLLDIGDGALITQHGPTACNNDDTDSGVERYECIKHQQNRE
ncbi:MAG: hypothetical protein HOM87_03700, partial [Proteobacteria bacterium]|nr:hypothetical protein [Pseudomonadota bacterium]